MPGKTGRAATAGGADLPGGHGGPVSQRLPGTVAQGQAGGGPLPHRSEVQRGHRWPAEKKSGVTAPPLHCEGEERLTSDELAVRIETPCFVFNALLLESLPVAADPHAAEVQ